jgi:hypothetical protein
MFPKNHGIKKIPSLANVKMEAHMLIWYFRGITNSYNYKKDHLRPFLKKQTLRIRLISCTIKTHTQIQELKGQQNFFMNFISKKLLRPLQITKSYSNFNIFFKKIHSLEKEDLLESTVEEGIP